VKRLIFAFCCVLLLVPDAAVSDDQLARSDAASALERATDYFRDDVAVKGGYVWRYSEDLTRREGEGRVGQRTIWVQPPGTPTVGMAYLSAYEATGEDDYLSAARQTAMALVRGQLRSGGWDYRIEFEPKARQRYAYRIEGGDDEARNRTTLDDDVTQAALRFLMHVDEALAFDDAAIHESVEFALDALLRAQYPCGAWPQRFDEDPDPAEFPVKRASYPETWSRTWTNPRYYRYYTLNDNTLVDMIRTMFLAARIYDEPRYRQAAEDGGGFLLLAQMPEPQPAWAQQYNPDMQPDWARRFEPPAISGGESQGAMRTLLLLYRETGERRYLEPLPRAIAYFRRSLLPDGRLARFYELETNRPLYFTRKYELTYKDDDLPTHYGFKSANGIEQIAAEYERLIDTEVPTSTPQVPDAKPQLTTDLERRAKKVVAALDDQGRWTEAGRLRYHGTDDPTRTIISSRTFATHVETLCQFLMATSE